MCGKYPGTPVLFLPDTLITFVFFEKTDVKFNFPRKKPKKACMLLPVSDK